MRMRAWVSLYSQQEGDMVSSETVQMLDQLYPKGVASPDEVLNLITSLGRSSNHRARAAKMLLHLCDVVLYAPVAEMSEPIPKPIPLVEEDSDEMEVDSIDKLLSKEPSLVFMFSLAKQYLTLTSQQQFELARKHRELRDTEALQQLILHNLRLVFWSVNRSHTRLDFQDAVQVGFIGLMRAAEKFDERFGVRFSGYAHRWIMQHIKRAEHDEAMLVRRPVHVEAQIQQYNVAAQIYQEQQGAMPTDAEMAVTLKWSQEKVVALRLLTSEAYIADLVSPDDEHTTSIWDTDECADQTTPEMLVAQKEEYQMLLRSTQERLRALLSGKKKRDRDIFLARYGLDRPCLSPRTLDDVGDTFGLTRERIRQIVMQIWKSGGEQWRNIMTETEGALEKIPALRELVEG